MAETTGLTRDAFLSGRVMVWQPATGYRAGIDAVMLAAAVPARPGQSVLELGCGVGAAALSLAARVPDLSITGVEIQPAYAALARRNAEAAQHAVADAVTPQIPGQIPASTMAPLPGPVTEPKRDHRPTFTVIEGDIAALPADLRNRSFDHVMMNPPYFRRDQGNSARDPGRETAFGEALPLADWLATGIRRLKSEGWLTVIHRAARLADILAGLDGRMGSLRIRPIAPRAGRAALTVVVQARKGGRAPLQLLPPLILHRGDSHPGDHDHFTESAARILKSGEALPMG